MTNSQYHFADEDARIHKGEEAQKRLKQVNDALYLSDDKGVIQVPKERWDTAQRFERKGWMESWVWAADDRNYDHMDGFDGYRVLVGRRFDHAIELGCGPFTNTRLIGNVCSIRDVTLLDPLIDSYLTHPNVTYSRAVLRTVKPLAQWRRSGRGLVHRVVRKACELLPLLGHRQVPVRDLFNTPIETMPDRPNTYDLVILINVIEHCFDAKKIFETVLRISRPGAVFVFHDHLYDHDSVAKMIQGHHYEAGHPLMVDHRLVEDFCRQHYEPLFERYGTEPIPDHPIMKEHRLVYFIGQRKG